MKIDLTKEEWECLKTSLRIIKDMHLGIYITSRIKDECEYKSSLSLLNKLGSEWVDDEP